ncbi:MAG TPA: response regulator [Pirellulaceae bacterium]|nr:response regulator [Pirellulaceae bacterium]
MSQKTILVIDDSSTIRRLVDRCLTAAGFRVVTAATAEQGLELIEEVRPDLVLLDHQLPGTTGTEVCRQILERENVADTPVVVSSTLRNRAYAEYTELPNVVDMLPKPYTDELLKTTVQNALETGKLVVSSQSHGTAVPEVIRQQEEPDLSGRFVNFRIREVLDFLNNAGRSGLLEVEGEGYRVFFYLDHGRITGVSAHGVNVDELAERMPETMRNLKPILALTVGAGPRSELDGIVELLNRKVVDSRLLRGLLRCQAGLLMWRCFNDVLKEFRFTFGTPPPSLIGQLSLDTSAVALLIEGALGCNESDLPAADGDHIYLRATPRGQNLDRAGVSAKHLKLLQGLNERSSASQLAVKCQWSADEVRRVLRAFELADLVERHTKSAARQILVFDTDAVSAGRWREKLDCGQRYFGKVVRDEFAMNLVLKRAEPTAFVFAITNAEVFASLCELRRSRGEAYSDAKWIGLFPPDVDRKKVMEHLAKLGFQLDAALDYPANIEDVFAALDNANHQPDPISPLIENPRRETARRERVGAGIA